MDAKVYWNLAQLILLPDKTLGDTAAIVSFDQVAPTLRDAYLMISDEFI